MSQRELLVCASQSAVKSQPTPAHYERKSTALLVAYRQCCVLKSGIRPVRGLDRSDLARAAIALSAARPIVGGELLGVSLGETRSGTIHLSGCHADKVRRELGDVFASLTQWPAHRYAHGRVIGEDAQPLEILTSIKLRSQTSIKYLSAIL